jgi:hypothetical protein
MTLLVSICVVALLVGAVATWTEAQGQRWRWGWRSAPGPALGDGAYREMPITIEVPRRMPVSCAAAAVSSVTWGVLTVFVFAPAGSLCCLLLLGDISEYGVACALGTAGMVIATIRGYAFGVRLMGLVRELTVRTASSAERVGRLARQSFVHHAMVAASFSLAVWAGGAPPFFYYTAAVPCAIGAGHAALLLAARSALLRLDREDQQRRAA